MWEAGHRVQVVCVPACGGFLALSPCGMAAGWAVTPQLQQAHPEPGVWLLNTIPHPTVPAAVRVGQGGPERSPEHRVPRVEEGLQER